METLKDIGELAVIERITRMLPGRQDVVVGAGDDCAVVRPASSTQDLVLTSDPVVEGVHFMPDDAPEAVGHKALGRMLSDIAAMGAEPRWALVDVVAPGTTPAATVDALYAGMGALATTSGLAIVGGDVAEGPCLEIHVFGVGAVPAGQALLRSGAQADDLLFVTGALGGSRVGRHLRVEPRLEAGAWLRNWASAMIDISDGLATDLRHITESSHIGCDLDLGKIPISPDTAEFDDERSPLQHALYDGEDFELLFTLPAPQRDPFLNAWRQAFALPCAEIGRMTASAVGAIRCIQADGSSRPLEGSGYSHF
jgi:thiamine-monophosphate kinase